MPVKMMAMLNSNAARMPADINNIPISITVSRAGSNEAHARADAIDQPARDRLHERVREQEGREDRRVFGVADLELIAQRRREHRQHLTIDVTDRGGREQQQHDHPAKVGNLFHDSTARPVDSGSAMHIGPWNSRDFPDMTKMYQPMFVIVGELTDVFFIEGAKEASRLWPNVRHETMAGTDHMLMLEDPETFNKLVLDFIGDVEGQLAGRDKWTSPPAAR